MLGSICLIPSLFSELTMCAATTRPQVHIGNVIRNALVFNFRMQRNGAVNTEQLLQAVEQLFALLDERKIEYLLVGGIALLQYIEGRNTEDIDLIMAVADVKKLPEIQLTSQDTNFARGNFGNLQIDLLLTRNPLFAHVRRAYATTQPFAEQRIPCTTVEGLLLLKLYALPSLYSQGNFARVGLYENDIATLLHDYRPSLAPLLTELAKYVNATDLASIREILADIQQRLDRFSTRGAS